MNNLAETLYAQGDLTGAHKLQEQVLEAKARLLGKEHPDTLAAMLNLAMTLHAQEDLAGREKLLEQLLEAKFRLLGGEHPEGLIAMFHLGGKPPYALCDLVLLRQFISQGAWMWHVF